MSLQRTRLSLLNPSQLNDCLQSRLIWTDQIKAGLFYLSPEGIDEEAARSILTTEEWASTLRLRSPAQRKLRQTQLVFRREVLRDWLDAPSAPLLFSMGPHGKPLLRPPLNEVYFSISHAENHWAIAINHKGPIGLDIEVPKPDRDLERLAKRVLTPNELAHFSILNPTEKIDFFYTVWTKKEAIGKASGRGIQAGFNTLETNEYQVQSGQYEAIHWAIHNI